MTKLRNALEDVRRLDPRPRGRAFEKFLGQVFSQDTIRHSLSYRPVGEEIDGAFWWGQRTFLLEAKWWSDPLPASAIYAFKGKVDGKFAETLGIFVSMSGYSKDCAEAVSHGKNLNILLFDDSDIEAIADGERFIRVLEEKMFAAGQTGQIYLPWNELQQMQNVIETVNEEVSVSKPAVIPLVVICEGPKDKLVIESLVQHLAQEYDVSIEPNIFMSHGKTPLLNSLAPSIVSLLANGISGPASVLLVFDADTTDPFIIEQQRVRARRIIEKLPPEWKGFVAIAVPEIEPWIGLQGRVDSQALSSRLSTVDWTQLASQDAEIAALVAFLRSVV